MTAPLEPLFNPHSIALIGATPGEADPWSFGARLTRALSTTPSDRDVYFVSRTRDEILGRRAYPSVSEIETGVELAIVVVPPAAISRVLEDCARAGVKACVIVTARLSADDRALMGKLTDEYGMRFQGPNCVGFLNNEQQLRAMATETESRADPGEEAVAIVSQSGGFCADLLAWAGSQQVSLSYVVSTGDEADVTLSDAVDYILSREARPCAIALFLEAIRDPEQFRRVHRRAADAGIPVVVLKVGRSPAAAEAALTHTGALVGDWELFQAVAATDRLILCNTVEEQCDVCGLVYQLSRASKPWPGQRVALVANSGGVSGHGVDVLSDAGLELSGLSPETREGLQSLTLIDDVLWNPFDSSQAGGTTRVLATYMRLVDRDPTVDTVVVQLDSGPTYATEILDIITAEARQMAKPVVVCWGAANAGIVARLREEGVPVFSDMGRVAQAIARIAAWASRDRVSTEPDEAADLHRPLSTGTLDGMTYADARGMLADMDVAQAPQFAAYASRDAVVAANGLRARHWRWPLVLKASVPGLVHKAEVGGVVLGIRDEAQLMQEYDRLAGALSERMTAVVVEEQIERGTELLLSARQTELGVAVTVGAGGQLANDLGDVHTAVTPLGPDDIVDVLNETRVGRSLTDTERGAVAAAADRMVESLKADASLVEIEINPAIVRDGDVWAADCKIVSAASSPQPTPEAVASGGE